MRVALEVASNTEQEWIVTSGRPNTDEEKRIVMGRLFAYIKLADNTDQCIEMGRLFACVFAYRASRVAHDTDPCIVMGRLFAYRAFKVAHDSGQTFSAVWRWLEYLFRQYVSKSATDLSIVRLEDKNRLFIILLFAIRRGTDRVCSSVHCSRQCCWLSYDVWFLEEGAFVGEVVPAHLLADGLPLRRIPSQFR